MITIYRKNYGAFLQAYALQQSLIKAGGQPEIIRYDYYRDNTLLGYPKESLPPIKVLLKKAIVETVRFIPHKKRQIVFDKSVKEELIESAAYYKSYDDLMKDPPVYDVYLTGSDQVFNPCNNSVQALPARLLSFVKNGLKYSYAASAGSDSIPDIYREQFKKELGTFTKVSVREEGLKQYLLSAYGIESERHIDPVFLLNKEGWDAFSKPIPELPKEYIFYYRVLPQQELSEITREISTKTGLPVFVADYHDEFPNQVKRRGFLSPEQWVYAINKASYVVTNSFHGTAFAINLEKRVSILIPPKGGERVKNLLNKCELNCLLDNPFYMVDNPNFDYKLAKDYIEKERERSMMYISDICREK